MKRPPLQIKNTYTYDDILKAYLDCRKRKRTTLSAISFEVDFERQLVLLLDEINSGSYEIGRSNVFAVTTPKPREIWAAHFRDRIVHHLVCRDISPWYEVGFIEDTYSCIEGRGTLAASKRVEQFCRKATEHWAKPAWAMQVDIANFFVSINRSTLWGILKKDIGTESLTAKLVEQIVFYDPTVNPVIRATHNFDVVPRHKSLWHCKKGYGLPIGNLTSQFFSNVYLDALDKFIKHVLRVKWYARYVDDMVFISHDKDRLFYIKEEVNKWLQSHRGLCLHPNKTRIAPVHHGIDFVGRVILPYRNYPRSMTVNSAKKALLGLRGNPFDLKSFESLQSYIGILRHSSSYNLRRHLCHKASLPCIIGSDAGMTKIVKLA